MPAVCHSESKTLVLGWKLEEECPLLYHSHPDTPPAEHLEERLDSTGSGEEAGCS